jgi:hypothetical protein
LFLPQLTAYFVAALGVGGHGSLTECALGSSIYRPNIGWVA